MGLVIGGMPRFRLARQTDPAGQPDDRPSYTTPQGSVFHATAPIIRSEAAVLLDNLMELTEVSALRWDEAAPAWAAQSDANLTACGITADGVAYDAALTRADAAEMLISALTVKAAR